MGEITQLYATLVQWAVLQGADSIDKLPGPWEGGTDQWSVKLNGHNREISLVPPFGYLLTHKTALVGVAIGDPFGGTVAGPSEDELISHFAGLIARAEAKGEG